MLATPIKALGVNEDNPFDDQILARERTLSNKLYRYLRWLSRQVVASLARHDIDYQLEQNKTIDDNAHGLGERSSRPQAAMGPRLALQTKALQDVVTDSQVWAEAERQFGTTVGSFTSSTMGQAVANADALIGGVDFALADATTQRLSASYTDDWWRALSGSTRDGLRGAIGAHIASGAPHRQLVRDITPLFSRARAEVIATTEVTRMYALGALTGYMAAGVTTVEWRTSMDERVCPRCGPLAGERFETSLVCGKDFTALKDLLARFKAGCGFEMERVPDTYNLRGDINTTDLFGRNLTPQEFGRLVGAPSDAVLYVSRNESGKQIIVEGFGNIRDGGKWEGKFRLMNQPSTGLVVSNDNIKISDALPGAGTKLLAKQVQQAKQLGIKEISLEAAGEAGSDLNGYYTWPRLGFDPGISFTKYDLEDEGFDVSWWPDNDDDEGYLSIMDMVATPGGRTWWKENGTTQIAAFDLADGSKSMNVLTAYMKEKGYVDAEGKVAVL